VPVEGIRSEHLAVSSFHKLTPLGGSGAGQRLTLDATTEHVFSPKVVPGPTTAPGGSGLPGTGSNDPCLPTGDGEATSHAPPLEDRTLSLCPPAGLLAAVQPSGTLALGLTYRAARRRYAKALLKAITKPGAGEQQSPPEPVGGPHSGAQGAEPPLYPESIAQSHIRVTRNLAAEAEVEPLVAEVFGELGLQGYFYPPPGPVAEDDPQEIPGEEIPGEEIPGEEISAERREGIQLSFPCPSWAVGGECEEGHYYAKEGICNREWCPSCGGDGGKAHQRRKASWLPKARQLRRMGKFVITVPPEIRDRYRDVRELAAFGKSVKRSLQGHGFKRGLRRFHFFGEDHPGEGLQGNGLPVFHPHLEAIVEAGHLSPEKLASVKASVGKILGVDLGRVNVHYEYTRSRKKMLHLVSYALRPTFEHWQWDEGLAYNVYKFKNALTWGKWDGPPAWDVPAGEDKGQVLEALGCGRCPVDGSRIVWGERIAANLLAAPWWADLGGGYWSWTGLARDGPLPAD